MTKPIEQWMREAAREVCHEAVTACTSIGELKLIPQISTIERIIAKHAPAATPGEVLQEFHRQLDAANARAEKVHARAEQAERELERVTVQRDNEIDTRRHEYKRIIELAGMQMGEPVSIALAKIKADLAAMRSSARSITKASSR